MNYKAHIAFGAYVGGVMADIYKPQSLGKLLVIIAVPTLIAPLADIDCKNSAISNRFPIVSFFARAFTEHRDFFHSPCFVMILYFLLMNAQYRFLVVMGYGGHLLQDLFTLGGIPLFYPITKKKVFLSPLDTGGISDWIVTIFLIIVIEKIRGRNWFF